MDGTRWPNVAEDVLLDIAGRLHDAADFVRFHSVCKPWRDSLDAVPPFFRTRTTQFLPWLLAPADKDATAPIKLRCIFSKSSYRVPRPPRKHVPRRNWISRADGTAVRYMTIEGARHRLHDPINGEDVTHLPRFRWDEGDPHGIVYGDGTVLLYSICQEGSAARLRAALLWRPGNAKWTLIERTFENPVYSNFCIAYHRGKILVTLEHTLWHVITPDMGSESGDVLVPRPSSSEPLLTHQDSYVLESCGDLLLMSVDAYISNSCHGGGGSRPVQALTVSVYVLEEETSASETMRWVEKDGRNLADRVFFLGLPNSYAIDAAQLGGHGGCAYFIYSITNALPGYQSGVYRYNLVDKNIDFVDLLPPGWGDENCTWLVPQPSISPIQEITKRSLMDDIELKQHHPVTGQPRISHLVRHYEPSITVLVRNLPISVKSSQLQFLFSKHGKVSHTKVIYYETTSVKWPVEAILTITTVYAHREEALDALNGLLLDGCSLKVSLVEEGYRRRRHGRAS